MIFFNLHATAMDVDDAVCLVVRRYYFLFATVADDLSLREKTVDQALIYFTNDQISLVYSLIDRREDPDHLSVSRTSCRCRPRRIGHGTGHAIQPVSGGAYRAQAHSQLDRTRGSC
jgi:hypothetical protein